MPISGDLQLRPLDALGGNKFYGTSGRDGNRLEALTASGAQYYHASAALTLPRFTLSTSASQGENAAGAVTLPSLLLDAGAGARSRLRLPVITLSAAGTVPGWGTADLDLPRVTVAGHAIVGGVASAALRLPVFTLAGRFSHHAALALPVLRVSAAGTTAEKGTSGVRLPALDVVGTSSVYSYPGHAALAIPALVMAPVGRATLTLPHFVLAASQIVTGEIEAWAMNLRNNGVTRLTAFPFTSFAHVGHQTYGVANGNLYLLGGDLDDEDPIAWSFQTGMTDFGNPGQKRLPYLYIDGIIDGKVQIVVIDDREREFAYHYTHNGRQHLTHRRKIGNGIKTRNVAYRIESDTGAYIEIHALEPEGTITERSI